MEWALSQEFPLDRDLLQRVADLAVVVAVNGNPVEAGHLAERNIGTMLVIPLIARDEPIGLIELWRHDANARFGERELRLGRALTATVATAMENARLHDETEQRLDELGTINELSRALTQIISIEDLYQLLQTEFSRIINTSGND